MMNLLSGRHRPPESSSRRLASNSTSSNAIGTVCAYCVIGSGRLHIVGRAQEFPSAIQ